MTFNDAGSYVIETSHLGYRSQATLVGRQSLPNILLGSGQISAERVQYSDTGNGYWRIRLPGDELERMMAAGGYPSNHELHLILEESTWFSGELFLDSDRDTVFTRSKGAPSLSYGYWPANGLGLHWQLLASATAAVLLIRMSGDRSRPVQREYPGVNYRA